MRIRSKGWDAKDQKLFITEGAERKLLGNDILPNLGIEVLQKQAPPNGPELRKFPNKPPIGTDVNQTKFASDRQPDQDFNTPLQHKGRKLMCRDRRHDWDTPDDIEAGELDDNSSSSDDISKAVRYVHISAGSPVKVLSCAEK